MFRREILEAEDEELFQAGERCYGLLVAVIHRCAEERRICPTKVGTVALSAWSLVHGFANLWISGRLRRRVLEDDVDQLADELCASFVARYFVSPGDVPMVTGPETGRAPATACGPDATGGQERIRLRTPES
jgi:hypothetical protein